MRNLIEFGEFKWVDIINPTDEDIAFAKKTFRLHPASLRKIIPAVMHPDFDVFPNHISMVLHYPRNEDQGGVEIHELDIIAGKNFLITNHYTPIKPVSTFFDECLSSEEQRKKYMEKGIGYLLFHVLNRFLRRVLEKTDKIGEDVAAIERGIFTEKEEKMVKNISYLKRRIISFWRAIDPQKQVFSCLETTGANFLGEEYKYYFSNLYSMDLRIDNSLRTYKETIESLEQTNHSMANLKRNDIIKLLTIFSVILMPLTLLASIWGMNTNLLPFMDTQTDFWLIMGLMAIVLISMLTYFKFRKWL
ncbi:MAG: magnesium transporter CorA family protein [Patescibacteria group bacterium]